MITMFCPRNSCRDGLALLCPVLDDLRVTCCKGLAWPIFMLLGRMNPLCTLRTGRQLIGIPLDKLYLCWSGILDLLSNGMCLCCFRCLRSSSISFNVFIGVTVCDNVKDLLRFPISE